MRILAETTPLARALGERLTLAQWGGALLILVAVVTIVRLQQQPAPAQVTTQAS